MSFFGFIISFFTQSFRASAHVSYVVEEGTLAQTAGRDWRYFGEIFSDPSNIAIMLVVAAVTVFLIWFLPRIPRFRDFLLHVKMRAESYTDFLPWMARLSIGIALMGAGTVSALFSPAIPAAAPIPFILILAGFFYLIGFLLIPTTLFLIIFFLIALFDHSTLLGNLDLLALLLAFLALHNERPGVDDIIGLKLLHSFKFHSAFAPLILRLGIGTSMIYLALHEKIFNPHFSAVVVNNYNLTDVVTVSPNMWVFGVGIIELAVGICLVLGYYTRLVSIITFAILSLSFFYFKESVYSHVTLFGLLSMLFVLGGGWLSVDRAQESKRT